MEKTYNVSEAADKLGVSVKTLQRWDRDGKLVANRTPSNRRYYTENQLREIKEGDFDMRDIYEAIKNKYDGMKERKQRLINSNIMGHIVYNFCSMQDKDRESFVDNYDNIEFDKVMASACDIQVNGNSTMSIITVPLATDNTTAMKWLYNYMMQTKATRGIVIKGTEWGMVDDGKEYYVDFTNDEVDMEVFERFAINR